VRVPFIGLHVGLVDDPLLRVSLNVVVAGCHKQCDGCCNPELWSTENAEMLEVDDIVGKSHDIASSGLVESVVLLGGDWGEYPQQAEYFAKKMYELYELPAVLYTGETYESLPQSLRTCLEVVIDGRYDRKSRGVWPASTNQRVFLNGKQVDPTSLAIYSRLSK
jgi:anaerobic ribonucleoside-triphosphate reductase activating protein